MLQGWWCSPRNTTRAGSEAVLEATMALPCGTVPFLSTRIEESASLWAEHPMRTALDEERLSGQQAMVA